MLYKYQPMPAVQTPPNPSWATTNCQTPRPISRPPKSWPSRAAMRVGPAEDEQGDAAHGPAPGLGRPGVGQFVTEYRGQEQHGGHGPGQPGQGVRPHAECIGEAGAQRPGDQGEKKQPAIMQADLDPAQ